MITVIVWFFIAMFAIVMAGAIIVALLAFIARLLEGCSTAGSPAF